MLAVGSVGYLLFMVVNFWLCDLLVTVVCAKGVAGAWLGFMNLVMLLVFMLGWRCFGFGLGFVLWF